MTENLCRCTEYCVRCVQWTDGSGGFFCPYVPKGIEGHDITCRKIDDPSIKATIKDSPSQIRATCEHSRFHIGSGGYYIICTDCGVKWVAIKPGNDTDLDRERKVKDLRIRDIKDV